MDEKASKAQRTMVVKLQFI